MQISQHKNSKILVSQNLDIKYDTGVQQEPRIGRDKLRKGLKYFRSIYPDICFTVQQSTACTDSQKASNRHGGKLSPKAPAA